ncbi:hypothetical protein Tco_0215633 [Tanacetum coccineum]
MPHESSPRVTYLDGGKSSMQQKLQELMDMCTNLQQQHLLMEQQIQSQDLKITQLKNRVKTLEDNEKTREGFALKDAPNTRGMDQGEDLIVVNAKINNEKSTKKGSDSTYEMANVLSTLGAANVLSSGITAFSPAGVATASGSFPTAAIFTTTSVTTPYTRKTRASRGIIIESSPPISISIPFISKEDKGKGIMIEPEQPSKEKSKVPLPGADETASLTRDDRHREAFPTATSLDAGQDRENITKTFVMPHESSPRVTSLDGGGGNLEITQLKNRVKTLEDNEKTREGFAPEDAPNTGGGDQGEDLIVVNAEINNEKSTKKGSDSTYEMANVLSTLGTANILSSGITKSAPAGVTTASGCFPTAHTIYRQGGQGKGLMTELEQPVKKREQAERDFGIVRIHAERELEMMIAELDRSNEMVAKYLCEYEQAEAELSHDKKEIRLGLILYRAPCAIKGVFSLDLSKVTITLQAKALDPNTGGMNQGEDLIVVNAEINNEKSTKKGSDSTYEMANVLSTLGAANVLSSGITTSSPAGVATASGSFPTAAIFTTTSVTTPYTRKTRASRGIIIESLPPISVSIPSISKEDKGKGIMTEPEQLNKEKVLEQMSAQLARELEAKFVQEDQIIREQAERDFEIVRIHAERELEMMIAELDRSNEMVAKYLCEYEQAEAELSHDEKVELINELLEYQRNLAQIKKYQAQQSKLATKAERRKFYMSVLRSNAGWKVKDFKGMTFEQIEEKFIPVWEKIQDFVPMNSKLESERVKRPGSQLVQESSKKLKTTKASGSEPSQEQQTKEPKELSEEELKKMMEIVPVEEFYIEALHAKYLIID